MCFFRLLLTEYRLTTDCNTQRYHHPHRVLIAIGSRRGLFAKDTAMVLDHLIIGTPLYVTPEASLYTLKVADAASKSTATASTIEI